MHSKTTGNMHYVHFAIMMALSFIAMLAFMYAMADVFGSVYINLNQAYMAGLMVAPMAILEFVFMGTMYPNKTANLAIIAASAIGLALFWFGIREQAAIADRQFLKSMIPHRASAILMCNKAPIADAEIKTLCAAIKSSQQAEIDQVKNILERLDK